MSYIIDKWNKGEVHFHGDAIGWKMEDGEFRPLMSDALEELYMEALIDMRTVNATNNARIYFTSSMDFCTEYGFAENGAARRLFESGQAIAAEHARS